MLKVVLQGLYHVLQEEEPARGLLLRAHGHSVSPVETQDKEHQGI